MYINNKIIFPNLSFHIMKRIDRKTIWVVVCLLLSVLYAVIHTISAKLCDFSSYELWTRLYIFSRRILIYGITNLCVWFTHWLLPREENIASNVPPSSGIVHWAKNSLRIRSNFLHLFWMGCSFMSYLRTIINAIL
jgi:hypothetical protein